MNGTSLARDQSVRIPSRSMAAGYSSNWQAGAASHRARWTGARKLEHSRNWRYSCGGEILLKLDVHGQKQAGQPREVNRSCEIVARSPF